MTFLKSLQVPLPAELGSYDFESVEDAIDKYPYQKWYETLYPKY